MEGPRILGSFRGRVRGSDITIMDFVGEQEARNALVKHIHQMGMTIRAPEDENVPDWEVLDFYEKTHPGEV